MSLTRNGVPFAETLPTHGINALVYCAWNLQLYHLTPMDISGVGYPGQRENQYIRQELFVRTLIQTQISILTL